MLTAKSDAQRSTRARTASCPRGPSGVSQRRAERNREFGARQDHLRAILAVVEGTYEALVALADDGLVDFHDFSGLPEALRTLRDMVA